MNKAVLLVFALGFSLAADKKAEDAAKKEYEKFTGTWKVVSLKVNGMQVPKETFADTSLVLEGNKFTYTEAGNRTHGTYKVDPSKKPKTMDIFNEDGPQKGKTIKAIYELKDDEYKICLDIQDKGRPTEFAAKEGSGHALEVLKREKK